MTEAHFYSRGTSTPRKSTDQRGAFMRMTQEDNRAASVAPPPENGASPVLVLTEAFTAEDAINRAGIGKFQVKLTVLCGFVWMAKGFDNVVGMFINSLTTCEWSLLRWHSALMVTITTIFTIFGCIIYGMWSDKYGRRTALSSSLIFVFVFSAVSVGLPSYTWFLVFRSITAFSVGGFAQALTLCCEYVPGRQRGRVVYILSCFWAVGVTIMLGLLYAMTRPAYYHWRLFAAVSTTPSLVAMIMMRFFPESIHYLLVSKEYVSAKIVVEDMARVNKKSLPQGQLFPVRDTNRRGRCCHLLSTNHARSSMIFWYIGLTAAIAYYSLDIMSPYFLQDVADENAINYTAANFMGDVFQPVECLHNVTTNQYVKILWTNALDFPGFVIYMIIVDVIPRKILLCASSLLSSLFIFLLFIPTSNITMLTAFLFCARTLLLGQMDMLLLMNAEAYPTTERGIAVGMQNATFYMGFFLTPYISHGFLRFEMRYLAGFCGVLTFLSAIAAPLLTWETRGMELMDTSQDQ
ncbi:Synaptic vesicle 2-related protein [Araneus ventricosus]|uniref:Synaptic vesicle 2-related protein n=1 Tax=Araneus ventricosus TaxID=182803 RepID=A0A4Y2A8L5_ARAVE|nr:Synaptic vesicle 2-related protein [Araneus ventricosus]